jgi:hypothetical protein
MKYPSPRTKDMPDAMNDTQMEANLKRLETWAAGQYIFHLVRRLQYHEMYLDWYKSTQFKGRYKTNETNYHERSKVILLKHIYGRSKSKR